MEKEVTTLHDNQSKVMSSVFMGTFVVMALVSVGHITANVADGLVTGRLISSKAMAAYGLADPIYSVISTISSLFAVGMQIICAEKLAKGKTKEINSFFTTNFTFVFVLVSILAIVCEILVTPFSVFLSSKNTDPEVLSLLRIFLMGLIPCAPAHACTTMLVPFLQLDGDSRRSKNSILLLTLLNIAGDLICVTVLDIGIFGIGLSTTVAYWVTMFYLLMHFRKKESRFGFDFVHMDGSALISSIKIGYPKALRYIFRFICRLLTNKWILFLGAATLMSSASVNSNISCLPGVIIDGIQGAILLMVGVYYGEKDKASLQNLIRVSRKYIIRIVIPISLIGMLCSNFLARLYITDSPEVISLATVSLICLFAGQPFCAYNCSYIAYCQGLKETKKASVFVALEQFVLPLCLAIIMGICWGPYGLVASYGLIYPILTIIIIIYSAICNRGFSGTIEGLLSDTHEKEEIKQLSYTVTNMEEAVMVSKNLPECLCKWQLDTRRSFHVSLCVEEMVRNIMEYGFNDKKKHYIDIRIMFDGSDVTIRFRDNCKLYDFTTKMNDVWDDDDPCANVGVKLSIGVSKEIRYMNLLDTNVLSISI